MKKILIAEPLKTLLEKENSILRRTGVQVFTASTNDELLAVHRAEKANLIISQLDLPGRVAEKLFTIIRKDEELRKVSLIMLCADRPRDRKKAERCRANAVMALPADDALLFAKAQALLDVPWRESLRVFLSVNIAGTSRDKAFLCRSENISANGLLFETDQGLNVGDRLICSFFLPGAKRIIAAGEIVRVMDAAGKADARRYGVRFDGLAPEARAAIESFIAEKTHTSPVQSA